MLKQLFSVLFLIYYTAVLAQTIPYSFSSGDPISSSQMNENFDYLLKYWGRGGGGGERKSIVEQKNPKKDLQHYW